MPWKARLLSVPGVISAPECYGQQSCVPGTRTRVMAAAAAKGSASRDVPDEHPLRTHRAVHLVPAPPWPSTSLRGHRSSTKQARPCSHRVNDPAPATDTLTQRRQSGSTTGLGPGVVGAAGYTLRGEVGDSLGDRGGGFPAAGAAGRGPGEGASVPRTPPAKAGPGLPRTGN